MVIERIDFLRPCSWCGRFSLPEWHECGHLKNGVATPSQPVHSDNSAGIAPSPVAFTARGRLTRLRAGWQALLEDLGYR